MGGNNIAELLIGLIIGFAFGAYIFNRKVRDGVSKFFNKEKAKAAEEKKPKAKSRGGKA